MDWLSWMKTHRTIGERDFGGFKTTCMGDTSMKSVLPKAIPWLC